jgi:hypothetical protein
MIEINYISIIKIIIVYFILFTVFLIISFFIKLDKIANIYIINNKN